MSSILRKVVPRGRSYRPLLPPPSPRRQQTSIHLPPRCLCGTLLWLLELVGTAAWLCWLELTLGSAGGALFLSHSVLLVASFSISPPLPPPLPHPLFRPALSANVLPSDQPSIFKFGVEALACVVATACLFLSCLRLKAIISRLSPPPTTPLPPSRLCCDPCVGGGAPREHRGADEALGMPAGGEEPGAAEGESRRGRPPRAPYRISMKFSVRLS